MCLTFDDGPHPELTPRLLDILSKEQAKAAFFLVGHQAERYPEIVKRIEAEGHTVGHHSFSHLDPTSTSTSGLLRDLRRSSQVLQEILGHSIRLYRPPLGKLRAIDFPMVWALRQTIVLWNVDPKDYVQTSAMQVIDWFAARSLRGGDIVLMHDRLPHTVEAVPAIMAGARLLGLQFGNLEHWTRWLPMDESSISPGRR